MQCKYCNKQAYISHVCPCCKEYYCTEHAEPNTHKCTAYGRQNQPLTSPYMRPQQHATGTREKPETPPTTIEVIQRKLFVAALTLLLAEETLRLVSYIRNPPSLELNIYVAIASMWLTPYVASSIIFLSTCLVLLTARKKLKNRGRNNEQMSLLRNAIPIGIYATIAVVNIFSIAGWIFVLLI